MNFFFDFLRENKAVLIQPYLYTKEIIIIIFEIEAAVKMSFDRVIVLTERRQGRLKSYAKKSFTLWQNYYSIKSYSTFLPKCSESEMNYKW